MTFGYSTLEDAWGESFLKSRARRRVIAEPTCNLYSNLANAAGYDKNMFQRNTDPIPPQPQISREPEILKLPTKSMNKGEEVSPLFEKQFELRLPSLEETVQCETYPKTSPQEPNGTRYTYKEMLEPLVVEETPPRRYWQEPPEKKSWIDLVLYILSGIILIFILDQFVRIGMILKNN